MPRDWSGRQDLKELVVEPLPQRSVLASVLDDLLTYDATPEGSRGGDLEVGKSCDVSDQLLVDLLDFEFSFNLHRWLCGFDPAADDLDQLTGFALIQCIGESVVLLVEGEDGIEHDVKFFRSANLFPVADVQLFPPWSKRVAKAFFERVELHVNGNLDLLCYSIRDVISEVSGIGDGEGVW